jgi:hypothetical protein
MREREWQTVQRCWTKVAPSRVLVEGADEIVLEGGSDVVVGVEEEHAISVLLSKIMIKNVTVRRYAI